ncbi:MAG: imelysin family protein [Geminicoccaceae bacterium]
MRLLLPVLLLLAGPAAAQDLAAVGGRLRSEVLLPLYGDYRDRAAAFAAVAPDCAGDWRPTLRAGYVESALAWRRLEAAGTGPAVAGEASATVYFWPDKHGTAGRQLTAALRERNPALTDPAELAGRSVGLQSLATLEVLLYGTTVPADAEEFACRYAVAIADFQASLAARLAKAAPGDPPTDGAVADAMFRGMLNTLDVLIALDLERPLGKELAAGRGERARAWRSGLSLPLIGAALDTVDRVYTAPRSFSAMIQASAELSAFDAVLRGRLQAAREAIAAVPEPLHLAVVDPEARPAVEQLLEEPRAVRRLLQERLAPALGFAAGFNALDGD